MNRRKFFSRLAPLSLVFLWPKSSNAQKVQRERYIVPEQYNQRIIQDALDKISKRLQEGGL
jgi:hypothetical protein